MKIERERNFSRALQSDPFSSESNKAKAKHGWCFLHTLTKVLIGKADRKRQIASAAAGSILHKDPSLGV